MSMNRRSWIAALVAGCATGVRPNEGGGRALALGQHVAFARRDGASPTIVFESGLGDGQEVWASVIGRLQSDLAYFTYSRPGYGASEDYRPAAALRTSVHASQLLRAVLRSVNVVPPYVLVGHSLGGLYIARYAAEFPHEVAGLVFVDGRPPIFRALCDARGVRFCSAAGRTPPPPNWPPHIVAEAAGIGASEDAVPAMATIAGIPATIITSTRAWSGEQGGEGFALWLEAQATFARGFTHGRFVRAEGAGHSVHREQPALVAREIESLVSALRRG